MGLWYVDFDGRLNPIQGLSQSLTMKIGRRIGR